MENNNKNKRVGESVLGVTVVIILLAMWNPMISVVLSVTALLMLAVWFLMEEKPAEGEVKGSIIKEQEREMEENINKILVWIDGKERVTNNDVEALLGVSNASAERYLQRLEQRGVLKQVGTTGQAVYYEKIG